MLSQWGDDVHTVGSEIAPTETLEGEILPNSRNFCAGHSFHLGTILETLTKEKPRGKS